MRFQLFLTRLAVLFLPVFFLASCNSDDEDDLIRRHTSSSSPISRTVLNYIIGENNLTTLGYYRYNIDAMIKGYRNAPNGTNWLIYIDDGASPTLSRLYKASDGSVKEEIIKTYDDQHSTDPDIMNQVLKDAYTRYPADSLGLILSSHASGSLYSNSSYKELNDIISSWIQPYSFGSEAIVGNDNGNYSSSTPSYTMNITDLCEALTGIPYLHYIMFDACLMGNLETAYELKDYAHYMIAAPNSVPGAGFPYESVVSNLLRMDVYDLTNVINQYTTSYATNAYWWDDFASCGVYDLTKLSSFAQSFKQMLSENEGALQRLASLKRADMQLYEAETPTVTEYPDYPLYDIALLIDSIAPAETAAQLRQQLRELIVQYAHLDYLSVSYDGETMILPYNSSRVCGLSTYIPPTDPYRESALRKTLELSWYQDSGLSMSERYQP